MKKIVKLTESDLANMVKRVINESVVFDELKGYYNRCGSQPTNSTTNSYADEIYDSIDYQSSPKSVIAKINMVSSFGLSGIGTNEDKLIGVFKKMKTFDEFCSTRNSYSRIYKSDMLDDIDGDVDSDNIWKELSRTVRSLYEKTGTKYKPTPGLFDTIKKITKTVSSVGNGVGGGGKPTPGGGGKPSSDQNSELLSNAKKCGHNSVEEYKNSGWSCKGSVNERYSPRSQRKIVKENLSTRTGDLYAGINELIDREFDDVEPSDVVRILSNILKHHEGKVYRNKHNINPISKDEVLRNFKRF